MDILQYLIELLKTRKQIGIEGLGTLYKKKTPGRYDAETHSFLPPSYTLEFTSDVLEHTNLAEYIQTKRGISEDSAKYFVSQFVEEAKKALQNGEYEMENLGTFSALGEEVVFIPSQDINIGFDFFALPPITAQIQPENKEEEEVTLEETSEVTADDLPRETEEPEIEQIQVPEFEQEVSEVETAENEVALSEETEKEITEEPISETEQELNKIEEEVEAEAELAIEEVNETEEVEENTPETAHTDTAETQTPANVETNEATDSEAFEEITEVDSENPTNETEIVAEDQQEEKHTWDFNDENVVSAEDISKEETFTDERPSVLDSITAQEPAASISFDKEQKPEDIKLKSTTHEWDFNNIESKQAIEDNTLIGEFDKENFEEEIIIEKTKMPLYQKVGFGLIALLVLIVILYFVKPDIFETFERDTTNPDEKLAVPIQRSNLKTQQDSISFADSIMKNAEKVGLDVEPAKDTLKVTTTTKEVPTTYTFDVIIASFATDAKAQDYIARMKKKGFDAKISTMHGKRKNISIATYNNIDSAQKYVTKFRKQFKNQDIYAQPIKNK
ncbi:SPOR domain-containing protein [Pedobacter xixiisoli]|uniref:Sporulation related domain-containing protein n=1 Tax=Pedobacter xixiisoli TaxID=1476464 RepID=A0A285ZNE3_9SPHI|nr:SPOR domain-containing protein [Pedobacter xixiisoli]SOD11157.1 Sporulation related domain-containing protein [Pedobacter xixiisoli]